MGALEKHLLTYLPTYKKSAVVTYEDKLENWLTQVHLENGC